ncbi:tetratricopeptide repeat protein, partial [Streptomyces sp. NPDC004290]
MPRPSDEKREQKRPASPAAPAAAPIEVRVPASGPGAGGASIDGVPVFAARGEEIQQAVLSRLHRIARATGRPVRATIRDERIGFVVPILVSVDGASEFAGEPVRTGNPGTPAPGAEGETPAPPLSAGSEGHV